MRGGRGWGEGGGVKQGERWRNNRTIETVNEQWWAIGARMPTPLVLGGGDHRNEGLGSGWEGGSRWEGGWGGRGGGRRG